MMGAREMQARNVRRIWGMVLALMLCGGVGGGAQSRDNSPVLPDAPKPSARSIEDLNYLGGEASMPTFSDSVISDASGFRRDLFRKGIAFRLITGPQYTQNVLAAPVAADAQVYVGERPFESMFAQPILAFDLRQLHLRKAQLYMGADWNWVSWNPAGPKTLQLWALYVYKEFGNDRVEVKAGYIANNMNFVGLFVGGSTASGSQGVYAVLPYEAGMSYFPMTAPSFNVRFRGPGNTYLKTAAQRSFDPNGGPTEVARNHTGFRFIPHGDKLVLINEGGYQREAGTSAREAWLRGGLIYNTTDYKNEATGRMESGNYCGYALMDYQFVKTNREHPKQGIYAGGSFMTVPEQMDAYSRYYEARVYEEAPVRSRPDDLLSVVASRTGYSRVFTDKYVAEGKTVWRAGTTLTGSYSMHVSRGEYVSLGVSYVAGPAITPRVPNALNVLANWTVYF
ncbi:MAG: carbohydrate porin [Acidobacteria bacterium]|nr:carbohydrate porin [Acidobacteriota bacterium]